MVRLSPVALLTPLAVVGLVNSVEHQISLQAADTVHPTFASWGYTDCGGRGDVMAIRSIAINPDPPQRDHDLTVTVLTNVSRSIKKGAWTDVTVKLGPVKLISESFDFCDQVRETNVSGRCPYHAGSYIASRTVSLPKEIPPGRFWVNARGYNAHKWDNLFCVNITVDFT